MTYFWLKSKVYVPVPVMTNNTLAQTIGLLTLIRLDTSITSYPTELIIYTDIHLREIEGNICCFHEK